MLRVGASRTRQVPYSQVEVVVFGQNAGRQRVEIGV